MSSHKVFEALAEVLSDAYKAANEADSVKSVNPSELIHTLTLDIADVLAETNPAFNKVRFLNAANPDLQAERERLSVWANLNS